MNHFYPFQIIYSYLDITINSNIDHFQIRNKRQLGGCLFLGPPCVEPPCDENKRMTTYGIENGQLCPRCPVCKQECKDNPDAVLFAKCKVCILQGAASFGG